MSVVSVTEMSLRATLYYCVMSAACMPREFASWKQLEVVQVNFSDVIIIIIIIIINGLSKCHLPVITTKDYTSNSKCGSYEVLTVAQCIHCISGCIYLLLLFIVIIAIVVSIIIIIIILSSPSLLVLFISLLSLLLLLLFSSSSLLLSAS